MTERRKQLEHEAELMRLCLDYGLCTGADVIAWADREIETCEVGVPAVTDVALAGTACTQTLLDRLAAVPRTVDTATVRAAFLGKVADRLREDPDVLPEVVRILDRVAGNGDAPDEAASLAMRTFDNDYELVVHAGRSADELRKRLLAFLDEQAKRAVQHAVAADGSASYAGGSRR